MVIQIFQHLNANSLTCPAQHGFKAGHSTVTHLLEALNVWTEAFMHRHPIDVIYLHLLLLCYPVYCAKFTFLCRSFRFFCKLVNVGSLVLSSTSLYLLVLATVLFL